jgi:hypothetical protein
MAQQGKWPTTKHPRSPLRHWVPFFSPAQWRALGFVFAKSPPSDGVGPSPPNSAKPKTPSLRPHLWLCFFTSSEREKFTPNHPENHEYLTSLALLLIDSKNYPGFRPFFSQFLPLTPPRKTPPNRPSRPVIWVRFCICPIRCPLGPAQKNFRHREHFHQQIPLSLIRAIKRMTFKPLSTQSTSL